MADWNTLGLAPINTGKGWYGVDLDRTLAYYDTWKGSTHIGAPIPQMVTLIHNLIDNGQEVRIFTARVSTHDVEERGAIIEAISAWCHEHIGCSLPVTCIKDFDMLYLYDDRAIQVVPNTGQKVVFG